MKNALCAIVIPFYKENLNELEKISYDRAKKVFDNYDIFAILPEKLKGKVANDLIQELFDDDYFLSVDSYSRLLLSKEFYKRFNTYQYILIYQLDAFVFDNTLDYFCRLGYDYIGAPWIDGMMSEKRNKICFVGNGGLTLRKVCACIELIDKHQVALKEFNEHEDLFFSLHNGKDFKVAPVKVALKFSIESKVNRCIRMNNGQLPFGCHAWEKYNYRFWKPQIEKYGYLIDESFITDGNLDVDIERGIIRHFSMWLLRKFTKS